MPTDKTENQDPETPTNPTSKGQIPTTGSESQQGSEEHIRSAQTTRHESRHNKPQSVKITQVPKIDIVDSEQTRKSNSISLASVIVNGFLFLCTLTLAFISYKQAISADSAAKTAQNTFEETKRFDSVTLANQKKSDSASNDSATKRYYREIKNYKAQTDFYDKQKQGVDSQIKAIKISQAAFKTQMKTFPQIEELKFIKLSDNEPVKVSFNINVVGMLPIKIINNTMGFAFRTDLLAPDYTIIHYTSQKAGVYIRENHGLTDTLHANQDNAYIDAVNKGNGAFYAIGNIVFRDVDENQFIYRYSIKLTKTHAGGTLFEALTDTIYPYKIPQKKHK